MAAITLSGSYVETKDYGTNVNFSAVNFDAEAKRAHLILVMVDGATPPVPILPKRFVEFTTTATGSKVKKLNGDIKDVPALTYDVLKAASDTGAAGLVTLLLTHVPAATFASGT